MATFLELCLDTSDPESRIASFWAEVSGGRIQQSGRAPADVVGRTEQQGISICPVPEPKTVKNRVHLDIYTQSVVDLEALDAGVLLPAEQSGFGWTVMRDPEGNEFCAFVREELPDYRVHGIGVDCVDAEATARWWAEAFGVEVHDNAEHGGGWWTLEGVTDDRLSLDFESVPEPKTVKNRMHWDVRGSVEEFLDRGATRLWEMPRWTVLADPEGNEFCVFPQLSG